MNSFNYDITLIPNFRIRKRVLDVTTMFVRGRELKINPIMTTNLLIIDRRTKKYMPDKLAMLFNSIIRDTTLEVTGRGLVSKKYTIKYKLGRLSIIFSSGLTLTVVLARKMAVVVDSSKYIHDRTNIAIMLYVASAIMNIPKYEYPISIVDSDTSITTILLGRQDVLYTYSDDIEYPKKIRSLDRLVLKLIKSLRDKGDVIRYINSISIGNITRVLALINYCRYYSNINTDLITTLLKTISNVVISNDHIDNMIEYMSVYRELVHIEDKYSKKIIKRNK